MTKPTITHGHGFLNDMDDTTDWTETESGMTASIASKYGDILQITCITNGSGDQYAYYEHDLSNISSTTFTKYVLRWKTSEAASPGVGARARLMFTSGDQWILGETTPQFSSTWNVATGTITGAKTIDKVRLYADDYPDAQSGTYYVYYDFVLLCQGIWELPFVDGSEELEITNNYAYIKIPGRVGNVTQYLGMDSPIMRLSGTMDTNSSWGSPDGEYFYGNTWAMFAEPWQWLSSDVFSGKITVPKFKIGKIADSKRQRTWSIDFRKYDLSSGDEALQGDLQWFGFE